MMGSFEYGSGERKCVWVSCRPHDVTSQRTGTIIDQAVRLYVPVADGNLVFVRGGEFLAEMFERTLLDYHSVASSFILFYVSFDWSVFLYWGWVGLFFRISDWKPTNSSRVPDVGYQSIQLNSRIVCSNQFITTSFYTCSRLSHIHIPLSFSM